MARDAEGNTAIHLAAMYQSCLEPLLEAMNRNNVKFDLDAYNLGTYFYMINIDYTSLIVYNFIPLRPRVSNHPKA